MKKQGLFIPFELMGTGLRLQGCELLVFATIRTFSTDGAVMFCSERYLAEILGYRRECISRALKSLLKKNLIIRSGSKHKPGNTWRYYVNTPEIDRILQPQACPDGNVMKSHTQWSDFITQDGDKKSTKENNRITNSNIQKKNKYGESSESRDADLKATRRPATEFNGTSRL